MVDFNRPVHALLGLPLDAVTSEQALDRLVQAKITRKHCFLSTPNLNFLISSIQNESFRASVCRSDLSVADGMPLVWMARLLGIPIRERVAGSSLFESLEHTRALPWRIFFFGGGQGAAMQASLELKHHPGLVAVGLLYPGFGSVKDMSSDEVIDVINDSDADFLVVSLGAVKGQEWISANLHRLKPMVVSHLGAVVNFVAGSVKRSPSWMQKLGMEWLWRIKEEPQLWRRYLNDGVAVCRLLVTKVFPLMWLNARSKPLAADISNTRYHYSDGLVAIELKIDGPCVEANLHPLRKYLSDMQLHPRHVVLDLSDCNWMDSAACGLLMLLDTWLTDNKLQLQLKGLSKSLCKLLALHGLPERLWLPGKDLRAP